MTNASAAELLVPIWQRVLQRSPVQANDNFFDLGGDPASAAKLFAEIAEVFGRHLSPVLIYSAPTIDALASLLDLPTPPRVPPLLLLKPGAAHPPIFISHGLGDTVLDLFNLVKTIESKHPIYGMQAKGVDGVDEPFRSIEDMAQFHLEAIKKLQPRGPYLLIGYSLGGLVALEIAQRMSTDGEQIALLTLVDSYPHRNQRGLVQRIPLSLLLAKRRLWPLTSFTLGRRRLPITESIGNSAFATDEHSAPLRRFRKRVRDSAYLALKRYRPQRYRGKINFVRAEVVTRFPDDPATVWSSLAEKFEVETIPGNHWNILTTQFENLGSVLTRYLKEALI